jgi:hypothetical protein
MKRAAFLASVLIVAGCGSNTTAKPHGTTGGKQSCPPFSGGTADQSSPAKPAQTMLMTALAINSTPCKDRIVFDFRPAAGQKPGFRVEYRPARVAQTEDGSGKHIAIAGKVFLVVRFEPAATADLSGSTLKLTYNGPRKITTPGMHFARQVAKTGDFEAVLTWAIGLSEKRPFKLTSSGSPPRLTIELG